MTRLSDNEINQLKTNVSLQALVESSGIVLKKQGKDYLGHCPFHDDKTPSLVISPDKNLWHCLGACDEGGDVIQWVMKREGLSFRDAVALLMNEDKKLVTQVKLKVSKPAKALKFITPLAANPDDQALLRQILDYYQTSLKQNPKALAYLESRGLMHPELIEHFQLGFADVSLSQRLPHNKIKAGAAVRDQLKQIGILRANGQAHFLGCLLIPVLSPEGVIGEVYGRRITANVKANRPQHLYLPKAHQGVFNEIALSSPLIEEVILCESLIDALTFWVAGFRHVTASYGTSGFTEDHLTAFKKYSIKRVLIAYDRDEAGNKAAGTLAEKLMAEGIECFRVLFPKGMDANQYALDVKPAEKSLGVVLRSAQWMGKGQAPALKPETAAKKEKETETKSKVKPENKAEIEIETEVKTQSASEPKSDVKPEPETEQKSIPSLAAGSSEPTQASPQPATAEEIKAEVSDHEVKITLGDRQYRIRGLGKNKDYEQLKINLRITRGEAFHVDSLDLYLAKQRATYIKHAGMELSLEVNLLKRDLGKVLLKLESLQDEQIKANKAPEQKKIITLSEADHTAALELLKSPQLMQRIVTDIERCGVVGEATNSQVCYLACLSRKLEQPLAIIIQSTSAAGKSALMDAVLALMPEEEAIQYSAMTGQSLFYLGESDLKHKILAIAEEEGVKEASYALKLLQSQGELTIASTGKDANTGQLVTQEYHVEGPVMLFLTTTAIDLDEELKNRCLVLSINETREQTQTIQQRQRFEETLDGMLAGQDKTEILTLHRNAQRLLRPLRVVNPFAEQLTFIDDRTRTRRDHKKYLGLIKAIALLHQYQREIKTVQHNKQTVEYIEVTLNDIDIANQLAHEVLGRTLDELPPQTRRLLGLIYEQVTTQCTELSMDQRDYRFSRREIREYTAWGNTQLKTHLKRLEELEYLILHRGGRGQTFVYELAYQGKGEDGHPFLMGLLDIKTLNTAETKPEIKAEIKTDIKEEIKEEKENKNQQNPQVGEKKSGKKANLSGSSRGQVAPKSGGCRGEENGYSQDTQKDVEKIEEKTQKRTVRESKNKQLSPLPDATLPDVPPLAAQSQTRQSQQG